MQRPIAAFAVAAVSVVVLAASKTAVPAPSDSQIPALASSFASRLAGKTLKAPDGTDVSVATLLDAARAESCLRNISQGGGWPAAWLIVADSSKPYDLILRVELTADGSIADPSTAFLAPRRDWDDAAFDAAVQAATGKKPPRERQRNVVVQTFTTKVQTDYVYELPATGKGAKGLLALLPEGALIREAPSIDLKDDKHHTIAVALVRPRFVPADCSTKEGKRTGHRDSGGILLVLAGDGVLEDTLDITETVRAATGATFLPRFACEQGDTDPGAIDALVDRRFEGREPIRLLDFSGHSAQSTLDGLPVTVGIKRTESGFKLFAK
jgi:hypothetical protein